jgi:hypothetical protein
MTSMLDFLTRFTPVFYSPNGPTVRELTIPNFSFTATQEILASQASHCSKPSHKNNILTLKLK